MRRYLTFIFAVILAALFIGPAYAAPRKVKAFKLGVPENLAAETQRDFRAVVDEQFDGEAGGDLYLLKLGRAGVRYEYQGEFYHFEPIAETTTSAAVKNECTTENLWPHVDEKITARKFGVRYELIIKSADAPRKFEFRIERSKGWNDKWILPASAWDADGQPVPVVETEADGILTLELPEKLDGFRFPIVCDPTFELGHSNDDASSWINSGSDINYVTQTTSAFGKAVVVGYDTSRQAYFRWALDIPAGSTINSAVIKMKASVDRTGEFTAEIYRLSQSSSPAWQDSNGFNTTNYSDGTALDAISTSGSSVSYAPPSWTTDTWYESSDITTLVQAAIDDATYDPDDAETKYIGLKIHFGDAVYADTDLRAFYQYDNAAADAAELIIDYTGPATGAPQILILHRRW